MFDQATGSLDAKHRGFFAEKGDARQVWARRRDGSLTFLAEGGVTDEIRDACRRGDMRCPMGSCADPRFVARGGQQRRHHFAHVVAHVKHANAAVWRTEATAMLTDWARGLRGVDVTSSDDGQWGTITAQSERTGRVVSLRVTYDRRARPSIDERADERQQLLVGHTRGLLLPREVCRWRPADAWWCGAGQLVDSIVSTRGYALAVNPQQRLVATLIETAAAKHAGLLAPSAHSVAPLLCIVEAIDTCRLQATGIETQALTQAREGGALDRYRHVAALHRVAGHGRPASTGGAHQGMDPRQAAFLRRAEGLDTEARLQLIREMFLPQTDDAGDRQEEV
jgi:hypothetical protein